MPVPECFGFLCRLIKWSQDTYKSGGHQAELLPILERCTRELQGIAKYRTDLRYLRVWIQYVSSQMAATHRELGMLTPMPVSTRPFQPAAVISTLTL